MVYCVSADTTHAAISICGHYFYDCCYYDDDCCYYDDDCCYYDDDFSKQTNHWWQSGLVAAL